MTRAALTLATGAIALSAITFTTSTERPTPPTAPAVQDQRMDEDVTGLLSKRVSTTSETTYEELFEMIGDAAGAWVIDWDQLESWIAPDEAIGLDAGEMALGELLRRLNARPHAERIALAPTGDGVEITTGAELDRRARTLVAYDITPIVERGIPAEKVSDLILHFVEPEHWVENGGDLASYQIVGEKMFVEAPPRFAPRIEWILAQLEDEHEQRASGEESAARFDALARALADAIAEVDANASDRAAIGELLRGLRDGSAAHLPGGLPGIADTRRHPLLATRPYEVRRGDTLRSIAEIRRGAAR